MDPNTKNPELYKIAQWADGEIQANEKQKGEWRDKNFSTQEIIADLKQHTNKLEASIYNQDGRSQEYIADCFCYLVFLAKNTLNL